MSSPMASADPYGGTYTGYDWGGFGDPTQLAYQPLPGSTLPTYDATMSTWGPSPGYTDYMNAVNAQGFLPGVPGIPGMFNKILGNVNTGQLGQAVGQGLQTFGNILPAQMALDYAKNLTPIDTSQLQNVMAQAQQNAPGYVSAALTPMQQQIAGGYGDLLQSQAQRGIRGSSFGDQDIANFLSTTGQGLSAAGANAYQQALGLQGNLAGQIAQLNAQSQAQKNAMMGAAYDIYGRALNPAGYAGTTNVMAGGGYGMPAGGGGGGGGGGDNMLGTIGTVAGTVFGGPVGGAIGGAIGGMLGK